MPLEVSRKSNIAVQKIGDIQRLLILNGNTLTLYQRPLLSVAPPNESIEWKLQQSCTVSLPIDEEVHKIALLKNGALIFHSLEFSLVKAESELAHTFIPF
jgi:hypothetical protein